MSTRWGGEPACSGRPSCASAAPSRSPPTCSPPGLASDQERVGRPASLFARIGVPLHLEVDPDDGFVATWAPRGGALAGIDLCTAGA
ncbi:MAG: hypothetical protein ACREJF_09145, partial [Candidatus Methylomirabilales bacterium]